MSSKSSPRRTKSASPRRSRSKFPKRSRSPSPCPCKPVCKVRCKRVKSPCKSPKPMCPGYRECLPKPSECEQAHGIFAYRALTHRVTGHGDPKYAAATAKPCPKPKKKRCKTPTKSC